MSGDKSAKDSKNIDTCGENHARIGLNYALTRQSKDGKMSAYDLKKRGILA
jgi:hypothetical protein